jgi:hypothetical protein
MPTLEARENYLTYCRRWLARTEQLLSEPQTADDLARLSERRDHFRRLIGQMEAA